MTIRKPGFNGGLASFDASYLRDMKMLALVDLSFAVADFPSQYDMPLGFATAQLGQVEPKRRLGDRYSPNPIGENGILLLQTDRIRR